MVRHRACYGVLVVGKWVVVFALVSACSGTRVVSVLSDRAHERSELASPLRVTIDATNAHLPLSVAGANVAYGDVDHALAGSVERATRPLVAELARRNARPLELAIEIVEAHADEEQGRLLVRMSVRATLRERAGNTYVAQTHAHASTSAVVPADHGGKAVLEVTDSLGDKLAGFLAGLDLR